MKTLENKVAFITGATRGIGKGISRVLAMKGAAIAAIGRNEEQGALLIQSLKEFGTKAIYIKADVTNEEQIHAAAERAAAELGGIDILCANAGIFPACKLEDMSVQDWDVVVDTNLKGMFFTVKACLPYIKKSLSGRIILTSSITGPHTGYPGWSHYGATKAGMLGFMRTAAIELAKYNITVNAVLPGNIMTEGLEGLGKEYLDSMAASIPLKRLGTVEDIGYAVAFIASEEAGYINGHPLVVDGGQILPESLQALEAAA